MKNVFTLIALLCLGRAGFAQAFDRGNNDTFRPFTSFIFRLIGNFDLCNVEQWVLALRFHHFKF